MSQPIVVLLGGTGFVGRHLAPRLAAAGWRVRIPSRNRDLDLARCVATTPGVDVVNGDVHDRATLRRLLDGASAVVNLVGILNERGRDGSGFRRAHVELAKTLVAACREAGVNRVVQMSALNAGRGDSHYLRTRGEAEQVIRESGLAWTIFQPSVMFGPGDGLFTRFAGLLALTPVLPLACPDAKFAPVYVGDVAEAIAQALQRRDTIGQAYELYGDTVMTLREIVRYTADLLGARRLVIGLPDALARLQALVCDFVPGKPFSTDNYRSLRIDSVGGIDGLHRLGIAKTPLASVVPPLYGRGGRQSRLDRARRVR